MVFEKRILNRAKNEIFLQRRKILALTFKLTKTSEVSEKISPALRLGSWLTEKHNSLLQ